MSDEIGCIISEGRDCVGPSLCNRIEALEKAGREVARLLVLADSLHSNVQWWGDTSLAGRRKFSHREETAEALKAWHSLVRPLTPRQRVAEHSGEMLS
jgi:hypothetical protein